MGVREIELCREIGTYTGLEEADKTSHEACQRRRPLDGQTRREQAGYLDSPKFKLCGVETPTMIDANKHMFWKCERLK